MAPSSTILQRQKVVRRISVCLGLKVFAPIVCGDDHTHRFAADTDVITLRISFHIANGVVLCTPPLGAADANYALVWFWCSLFVMQVTCLAMKGLLS